MELAKQRIDSANHVTGDSGLTATRGIADASMFK